MDLAIKPKLYKGVIAASALGASLLVNNSLDYGWRKITKEDPPRDPLAPNVSWKKALIWAVLTGILVSVARLLVEKAVYSGWAKGYGEDPRKYK
jgi:hypothetical protein